MRSSNKLIRMILDIGNFLNYKSPKGNSYGFKLQSLKDLTHMKSRKIDGKNFSLLEFLIINLRENAPEMLDFAKIFTPLSEAIKVDVDILVAKFNELDKYLQNLERDLESTKKYIEVLTESEESIINGTDRYDVIKS